MCQGGVRAEIAPPDILRAYKYWIVLCVIVVRGKE